MGAEQRKVFPDSAVIWTSYVCNVFRLAGLSILLSASSRPGLSGGAFDSSD
jgi:hypothetical protein